MVVDVGPSRNGINWHCVFDIDVERGIVMRNGDPVGSLTGRYLTVRYCGSLHLIHRIIYESVNGAIPPGMEIDHIDHDELNNKISNLRLVSRTENMRNRSLSKNNTSGVNGVSWDKVNNKWRVSFTTDGKTRTVGRFEDLDSAIQCRKGLERAYGYHKNHGRLKNEKSTTF